MITTQLLNYSLIIPRISPDYSQTTPQLLPDYSQTSPWLFPDYSLVTPGLLWAKLLGHFKPEICCHMSCHEMRKRDLWTQVPCRFWQAVHICTENLYSVHSYSQGLISQPVRKVDMKRNFDFQSFCIRQNFHNKMLGISQPSRWCPLHFLWCTHMWGYNLH